MLELIEFNGKQYPKWQASHNAARFCKPFADEVCKGKGLDIGYGKIEWLINDDAIPYDLKNNQDAMNIHPKFSNLDYIFSSHCLEHLPNWVEALDHWWERLKEGGILFLYLPHFSQEYWRPWNNKKHVHILSLEHLQAYFEHKNAKKILSSGVDLNQSFIIICEK